VIGIQRGFPALGASQKGHEHACGGKKKGGLYHKHQELKREHEQETLRRHGEREDFGKKKDGEQSACQKKEETSREEKPSKLPGVQPGFHERKNQKIQAIAFSEPMDRAKLRGKGLQKENHHRARAPSDQGAVIRGKARIKQQGEIKTRHEFLRKPAAKGA